MEFATASNIIGIGMLGVFCVVIAIHARSYLAKYGTVASGPAQMDGYVGGGDGSYNSSSGHGACGDSGGGDGGCDGGH
jgi:hypothetical protein